MDGVRMNGYRMLNLPGKSLCDRVSAGVSVLSLLVSGTSSVSPFSLLGPRCTSLNFSSVGTLQAAQISCVPLNLTSLTYKSVYVRHLRPLTTSYHPQETNLLFSPTDPPFPPHIFFCLLNPPAQEESAKGKRNSVTAPHTQAHTQEYTHTQRYAHTKRFTHKQGYAQMQAQAPMRTRPQKWRLNRDPKTLPFFKAFK